MLTCTLHHFISAVDLNTLVNGIEFAHTDESTELLVNITIPISIKQQPLVNCLF